ncbi:3'-5' exonuclease [Marinoscillum furvescens]|uniref:DNA polymerase-3 subunit epsilon n=1 Tax=Marinoscillum furvescens DSM 4134 TaxID=1122208 RepID=A0A3D9L2P5_MARFU|nr:exonuclease domain-containing protein [Marinoscillum furvescens]RED96972.1 DNA polymerase-3 subunit epsilon [Marinoscillum furvescens DSM 4134]
MTDHLLFVDTETSGMPENLQAPPSDTASWPFILQIAWKVYDTSGELLKTENHYIYEEEISIEQQSIAVHGITLDKLKPAGKPRKTVMQLLTADLRKFRPMIIGHFVEFDSKMIQVALHRSGMKNIIKAYPHFCTMRATTDYALMTNSMYPKLDELYLRLFNEKLTDQHDALADATATAKSYFALRQNGDITDDTITNQTLFVKLGKAPQQRSGCGLPILVITLSALILWLLN